MAKLKTLLEDVFQERPKVNKHEVIEGVKNYNKLGKSFYESSNILETAKQLTQKQIKSLKEKVRNNLFVEEKPKNKNKNV